MAIFDASNRDMCEVKRLKTNTPLQALVMMNDPTVLEASRVLSAKLLQEKTDAKEKINTAFRLIVCRKPDEKELEVLTNYYNKQLKTIEDQSAEKMLSIGEHPVSEQVDKKALAAMMRVISTIYNLEETIMKS
jgi:hypothetical protein